ncbi:hypothetical protein RBSH_01328 [Rhodopirellula baltica SH28]|uniref:Uncharacterized protein n=1 Tax=Rhodopirellula baltica SH28 TaxID=993517 RepID=K5EBX0_RHOBT|nr:hypothetical protein RBSH_01328 [Rhodopirellula baltica SH28]
MLVVQQKNADGIKVPPASLVIVNQLINRSVIRRSGRSLCF